MADGARGNVKNPAIRRIHADIRELQKDPSDQYTAAPLEENLFEWHFTLRGPAGTDFAGGVYHGRILLPAEYPFKPPNIMLLTPNGRFEVGKKICLSISAHHPEHWQPAWGVRLILEALISFFPTDPKGAVGSLDWTPQERRRLAAESQTWCCARCGLASSLLPSPSASSSTDATAASSSAEGQPNRYAAEIGQLYVRGAAKEGSGGGGGAGQQEEEEEEEQAVEAAAAPVAAVREGEEGIRRRTTGGGSAAAAAAAPVIPAPPPPRPLPVRAATPAVQQEEEEEEEDKLLYIALGLLLLIALLLGRKALRASSTANGGGRGEGFGGHSFGAAGGDEDYFVG